MAHRSILTSIWTSVLAVLAALLGFLGLAGKAAPVAAGVPAPAAAATARRRPAVVARRTWRAMMRGGSLPPTIKQRIRAEAHGKTPSVRRSTTAAAMAGARETGGTSLTSAGAASVPAAAPVNAPARAALALAA
ncbi:DUF6344 domain-containing protein [Streptomyces sp. NPDC054787]